MRFLVRRRNPGPLGQVRVQWLCHLYHVHLLVKVPPKISISDFMGIVKGRTAIRVFNKFKHLKRKPYWGNKFWAHGYCVDTVGLDSEMIQKYVKNQEQKEKRTEQRDLFS